MPYANATSQNMLAQPGRSIASLLSRAADCEKQVLIDKAPDAAANGMEIFSEKEAVAKANIGCKIVGIEETPIGITFVGANKLRNGGVRFQLNTAPNAAWIRVNMGVFLHAMGGESIFRTQTLKRIAEFVPVSFEPDTYGTLRQVGNASGLATYGLQTAQFTKAAHMRRPGQRAVHIILEFSSAEAANHVICYGIFIEGKCVQVRKLLSDRVRCRKCQGLGMGHVAAQCKSVHDACARCLCMHRTKDCTVEGVEMHQCVNCKAEKMTHDGHRAADCECPVFKRKMAQMQEVMVNGMMDMETAGDEGCKEQARIGEEEHHTVTECGNTR